MYLLERNEGNIEAAIKLVDSLVLDSNILLNLWLVAAILCLQCTIDLVISIVIQIVIQRVIQMVITRVIVMDILKIQSNKYKKDSL